MLKFAILLAAVAVCYGQQQPNTYYLYTKSNRFTHQTMSADGSGWDNTNFNSDNPTIILIHGYEENMMSSFNTQIRANILDHIETPHNVIVVDWRERAGYSYSNALKNVPEVAAMLVAFLNELDGYGTPPVVLSQLHLVGFGLGAHVAGMASRQLGTGNNRVGRITGLDPSGNGWGSDSERLRRNDANYVEVIHTDGSGELANGIGTEIGQINFYVNGGSNQPGCLSHSCSHKRAYEVFAASLEPGHYLNGFYCRTKTQLNVDTCSGHRLPLGGTDLQKIGQGQIYRANTRKSYPF